MNMPLRVLIVDDEPLAREKLRTLLVGEAGVEVVGECANGADAAAAIEREAPDLVFLDVQMPEIDGFAVVEAIEPERRPAVIFVTAHDQYALRAFAVHALDYLLKPFDRERFGEALGRARAQIETRRLGEEARVRLAGLLAGVGARPGARIVVREAGRVHFLRAAEIDWIEAAGNYATIHAGGRTHLLRETMKSLEERLDPDVFVRVHRSTIVRVDRIRSLETGSHGEYVVVLEDGVRLDSSRTYNERVRALIARR